MLSTGLQDVYYVVPDDVYESLDFFENKVYAFELSDWTAKQPVINHIFNNMDTVPQERLMTSKVQLFSSEQFLNRVQFFIGFMLSLIFLSASMSILYFYLQTSLAEEKEKYTGIRKIGLSIKEIRAVVTKELRMLIFVPFTFATTLLFFALFIMRHAISSVFFYMSAMGAGLFAILFTLSFFIIRQVYVNKLTSQ